MWSTLTPSAPWRTSMVRRVGSAKPSACSSGCRTCTRRFCGLKRPAFARAGLHPPQGRSAAAEALYLRAQRLREQGRPPDERSIATSKYNLGMLYMAQGRYAEAEQLLKEAVSLRQKLLPPGTTIIATSLL